MGGSVPELREIGIAAEGEMLQSFRAEVGNLLGRHDRRFPGAQPVSFARHHIQELQRRDYYVCEKSDGVRCLLYLTNDGGQELTYLIDRKNDFYYVEGMHFPRLPDDPREESDWSAFHTNTLLDGELLYDTYPSGERVTKFLVFDCLLVDGQNLMGRTLDKRLAYFNEKIHRPFRKLKELYPADVQSMKFQLGDKGFQLAYGLQVVFNETLPNLKHGNDGLIFTCRETPYRTGTDEHILKWKPAEENSVDFQMSIEYPPIPEEEQDLDDPEGVWDFNYNAFPTKITLRVFHGDSEWYKPFADLHLTDEEWERMKTWSMEQNTTLEEQIVECHKDKEGRWRFMRFRTDKEHGNHISVVSKVMQSIEDSVSKEDLLRNAAQIRSAWKAREQQRNSQQQQRHQQRPVPPPSSRPPKDEDDGYED